MRGFFTVSMRTVVTRGLRDRFAAAVIAGASVPLVVALGMILASAISGSSSPPPSAHLSALPPLTTSPPPSPPTYTNLPFSTATPVPSDAASPPPGDTSSPQADPFSALCQQTHADVSDAGLAAELCGHLAEAEKQYARSDTHAESDAVHAYVRGVRDAHGHVIKPDDADALVEAANALPGIAQSEG